MLDFRLGFRIRVRVTVGITEDCKRGLKQRYLKIAKNKIIIIKIVAGG